MSAFEKLFLSSISVFSLFGEVRKIDFLVTHSSALSSKIMAENYVSCFDLLDAQWDLKFELNFFCDQLNAFINLIAFGKQLLGSVYSSACTNMQTYGKIWVGGIQTQVPQNYRCLNAHISKHCMSNWTSFTYLV